MAESWEISEDGTEYILKLHQGVTFHNGEAFTADDVVFSWKRGSQPEMQYSDKWTLAKSVEKIDDFTVKITTEDPQPLFLREVAWNWAMVPKDYLEEVGEEGFALHPVGTGPFPVGARRPRPKSPRGRRRAGGRHGCQTRLRRWRRWPRAC